MSKNKRNCQKGSALITTVLVAVLVCALIVLMMSLSLYGQSLAKASRSSVIRQDRLDLLSALFLEFGVEPAEDFGYDLEIQYFNGGFSVMTVRDNPQDDVCVMLLERDAEGRVIRHLYNVYYPRSN